MAPKYYNIFTWSVHTKFLFSCKVDTTSNPPRKKKWAFLSYINHLIHWQVPEKQTCMRNWSTKKGHKENSFISRIQFQKTENFSINKGAGEQEGTRGASMIEHSLKAQAVVAKDRPHPSSAHWPERGTIWRAVEWPVIQWRQGEENRLAPAEDRVTTMDFPPVCLSQLGDLLPISRLCKVGTRAMHHG